MNKPSSFLCEPGEEPREISVREERICGTLILIALALLLYPIALMADSLWRDDVAKPMFADKRAVNVGDIITIVVQENTTTSKDNNTKTSKQNGMDASISSFLYSPAASGLLTKGGTLPALKWNNKNEFTGGGAINNSEKIVARIAARVVDVLPNRNLVIEGQRETAFGGENQTLVLRGVIRSEDVAANNTIYSYNIADATIRIVSKGTITDSQKKGWAMKLWDKISPF
ncbi:MAG: flagellar basal body L-ring protein FlgH [Verrucomicrobia bacterium]|nr:flagellar basal body L-ring protein FlgH [Verrucomicrobiota bacterium]